MSVPNVICIRDISLSAIEADEEHGGVNVSWLDDITSPLIVDETQAREVGRVAIDKASNHRHTRTLETIDAAAKSLQTGDIITVTASPIGMTAKKCRVVGVQTQAQRQNDEGLSYILTVDYYEPA